MPTDFVCFKEARTEKGFSQIQEISIIKTASPHKIRKQGITAVEAGEDDFNRIVIEQGKADIIIGLEKKQKSDFMHHRNSGLNQVLCKFAKKKNIAIGFSFSDILTSKKRWQIIGRMMQNVRLCRKYKLTMIFATFAKNKWETRTASDLMSMARCIGMTPGEAKNAVEAADKIIKLKWKQSK